MSQDNLNNQIFRKKTYKCHDSKTFRHEVNCTHWSLNNDCKINCEIKVLENPTEKQCMGCLKRKSYPKEILSEDLKTYKFSDLTISAKPTPDKIKSYLKAEASQFINGKVDDEIYNERKEKCLNCPKLVNNKDGNKDEIGWCSSCGCGVGSERARLSQKLKMPATNCPLGKFTPAIGSGFKVEDAIDSINGMIKTVKKLIK